LRATKIAVLAQNGGFGRDYLAGLRDALECRFDQIVSVETYEVTESTIDSQVVTEAAVFLIAGTPKFAARHSKDSRASRLSRARCPQTVFE
jgi:branched-chain amino acid transport system substrate-binding protein